MSSWGPPADTNARKVKNGVWDTLPKSFMPRAGILASGRDGHCHWITLASILPSTEATRTSTILVSPLHGLKIQAPTPHVLLRQTGGTGTPEHSGQSYLEPTTVNTTLSENILSYRWFKGITVCEVLKHVFYPISFCHFGHLSFQRKSLSE